jgi:hypothetical protein
MSRSPKVILKVFLKAISNAILLLVFGVISALLVSPRVVGAQTPGTGSRWAVLDVTAAINGAIEESKEGAELRERVVRRFSECSLAYAGLSTMASNAEVKKNYVESQVATMEVESAIARPLQPDKKLELEEDARQKIALMLAAIKLQGDREMGPLLRTCKALNDVKELKNALRALPSK